MGVKIGDVPCDGCTRCCSRDLVRLLPDEDPDQYLTEAHPFLEARMLSHKADGSCIYQGEDGCSIWDRRPRMCREMDCRLLAYTFSKGEAQRLEKQGALRIDVWVRGRELLREKLHCVPS